MSDTVALDRIIAWADLVYSPGADELAHVKPFGEPTYVLCGLILDLDWYGTGCQHEYDKARTLPVCPACLERV